MTVRVIQANGMDLSLFQFDYDLTWAVLFLNADRTVYGRYGTRDRKQADAAVSIPGFRKAMEAALQLHAGHPKAKLPSRVAAAPPARTPEEYPFFKGKYEPILKVDKKLRQTCMHCHQVAVGERRFYRDAGKPLPEALLWPYPNPESLGLRLDPKDRARVTLVRQGTSADKDGFRPKDELLTVEGQHLTSIADLQWILHTAGDKKDLKAVVGRGGEKVELTLSLPPGWRRKSDLTWRTSTWDLRRMATGGLVLQDVNEKDREKLGLGADGMALRINHVGQFGEHAAGRNAGFQKNDVVVSFDGKTERLSEAAVLTHALEARRRGDRLDVTVLRGDKKVTLKLPQQ